MNTTIMNKAAILEKYPEGKPICLNYSIIRSELLTLAEENLRLEKRLAAFEEGVNPDVAERFSEVAGSLNEKLAAILDGMNKRVPVAEICQFLHDAGYTSASAELKHRYDI